MNFPCRLCAVDYTEEEFTQHRSRLSPLENQLFLQLNICPGCHRDLDEIPAPTFKATIREVRN